MSPHIWSRIGVLVAVAVWPCALPAQPRSPVIQQRVQLDPAEPVGFRVLVTPDTVFVGQQATYEIGVFISESAQQRMRRNPEVVPAELRGVLAYDLGGPQSLPAITQHQVRSFPHVLQRALFPLAPGRLAIPASQLTYTLPQSASFFSREESATLRANEVVVHVKPLPLRDQPAGFAGAVGVLEVGASVDSALARVGEPMLLTVRLRGRGNVKLWPRPALDMPDAVLVPAGDRVTTDTTGQYVRGTREFDWLVTPTQEGAFALPQIEYAFFDPYEAAYRVASTTPITLTVAAGEFVAVPEGIVERDQLTLRTVDRGARRGPLSQHPLFWALLAAAPLPALRRRRHTTAERAASAAQGHRSMPRSEQPRTLGDDARGGAGKACTRDMRRAASETRTYLMQSLAAQLASTVSALSAPAALERRLRRRGVRRRTAEQVVALVTELDAAAWSQDAVPGSLDEATVRGRVEALLAQVTIEAMPATVHDAVAPTTARRAAVTPLLMLLIAGISDAGPVQPVSFETAVIAYDARQYHTAAAQFSQLAAIEPRHVDAWANAGTAAWAAGDTVAAVRAWQRALRLEPTATDVRRHLMLLPIGSWRGVANVPEVPAQAGSLVAALLWCIGWGAIAWVRQGRTPPRFTGTPQRLHRSGVGMLVLAVATGVWQSRVEQQLAHEALGVLTRAESMHVAPGREADVVGGTARGDVVRVTERRMDGATGDAWVGVTHADGRRGWVSASALVPLE